MWRPCVILLVLAEAACSLARQPPLARAAEYLWIQKAKDGGWHSHTYGLLRSGQSLTPFVLQALLEVPEDNCSRPGTRVDRAIAFIQSNTRSDGALGMTDPTIPDYPNYATALAISAIYKAQCPGWERQIQPMLEYLRTQQFTEQNGWRREDAACGRWCMGGGKSGPAKRGHGDWSQSRPAHEAH